MTKYAYSFDFTQFFAEKVFSINSISISESILAFNNQSEAIKAGVAKVITTVQKAKKYDGASAIRHILLADDIEKEKDHKVEAKEVKVTVIEQDCVLSARILNEKYPDKVAMLNMANCHTIGGGAFGGSFAQEEYLFCVSDLPTSLLSYAHAHDGYQRHGTPFYGKGSFEQTDVLSSMNVIFREKAPTSFEFSTLPKEKHFWVNIISSAAIRFNPDKNMHYYTQANGRQEFYTPDEAKQILLTSMYNQIRTTLQNGNKAIVLSAFGCGAFCNKPTYIARLYRDILSLPEFFGKLEVQFAIIDRYSKGMKVTYNSDDFAEVFAKPLTVSNAAKTKEIRKFISQGLTVPLPQPTSSLTQQSLFNAVSSHLKSTAAGVSMSVPSAALEVKENQEKPISKPSNGLKLDYVLDENYFSKLTSNGS